MTVKLQEYIRMGFQSVSQFIRLAPVLILLLPGTVQGSSITVSGPVSGTWSADTVLATGNLTVLPGETLVILPGTLIQFRQHYKLTVSGRLIANGAEGDTIIFTVRDTANFYDQTTGRGGWFGIRIIGVDPGADTSQFSYCRFEYGKAVGDSADQYGGALYAKDFGRIRIHNCLFFHNYSRYSGGAVYLWNADAVIEHCSFVSNYAGNTGTIYGYGGGICSMHAKPVIRYNTFQSNSSTGVGGGVSVDDSDPLLTHNSFTGNFSALGGALGVLRSAPLHIISNLQVTGNTSLFFGGGVCCIRSFPVFSNLTIAFNSSPYGGGIYCNDSAVPSFYNSIAWHNTGLGESVYIWDVRSAPNFYYSDIEGGPEHFEGSGGQQGYHGEYFHNMDAEPDIITTGAYPFRLNAGSPCINSGTPDPDFLGLPPTDLGGAPRIWDGIIDMGCHEFNGTTSLDAMNRVNSCGISVFPNPVESSTFIRFEPGPAFRSLALYNTAGNLIREAPVSSHQREIEWNMLFPDLTPGLYILRANGEKTDASLKIIIH